MWFQALLDVLLKPPRLRECDYEPYIILVSHIPSVPDIYIRTSEAPTILEILELGEADRNNIKKLLRDIAPQKIV